MVCRITGSLLLYQYSLLLFLQINYLLIRNHRCILFHSESNISENFCVDFYAQ